MKKYLLAAVLLLSCQSAFAAIITVDTTSDNPSAPKCSLREAITNANDNALTYPHCRVAGQPAPVVDEIRFKIPGQGVKTIKPTTSLPEIIDSLTIDGTTQPLNNGTTQTASCNPRKLLIQLDGSLASFAGLVLSADQKKYLIRGLVINNFTGSSESGIFVGARATTNIECNHIGTNAAGTEAKPNDHGIILYDLTSSHATVGGDSAAQINVISGNKHNGIELGGASHVVKGNHIGVDISGEMLLPNKEDGIAVYFYTGNSLVTENIIAGNKKNGVQVFGSLSIVSNRIYKNGALGIDLTCEDDNANDACEGVTPNDFGDGDDGANRLLNFPKLTFAGLVGNQLQMTFDLDAPQATYRVEFFANSEADPSGHGEGETYLGHADVSTDNVAGPMSYTVIIALPSGVSSDEIKNISSTTTFIGADGTFFLTSEFSPVIQTSSLDTDFGDAPDLSAGVSSGNYRTRKADNGARHKIGQIRFGQCVDGDNGLQHDVLAKADDANASPFTEGSCPSNNDEDGIVYLNGLIPGQLGKISFTVSAAGRVSGWMDWNNDGDWAATGVEKIVNNQPVNLGTNMFTFSVPSNAQQGWIYLRLRVNKTGGLSPYGSADNGEVEDYRFIVGASLTGGDDGERMEKWNPIRH